MITSYPNNYGQQGVALTDMDMMGWLSCNCTKTCQRSFTKDTDIEKQQKEKTCNEGKPLLTHTHLVFIHKHYDNEGFGKGEIYDTHKQSNKERI